MKASGDSSAQPPPYGAVPPGNTTAPYPVQPGQPHGPAPTGNAFAGYPPPPPGYPHSGVPISNVAGGYPSHPGAMLMMPLTVGAEPTTVVCPACHQSVQTDVKVVTTGKTHMFALLLAIFGCCFCCWIPYCVDSCRAKHHYCPQCKAFIAAYDR